MELEKVSKLTDLIGEWRRSQKLLFLFVNLAYFVGAWGVFHPVFVTPEVELHCLSSSNSSVKVDACSKECRQVKFDHEKFTSTLTEKLDLICSRSWFKSFTTTVMMGAGTVAILLAGDLADRFGRRRVILSSFLPTVLGILLCLFPQNYAMYLIGAVLIGTIFTVCGTFSLVLLLEITGDAQRPVIGTSMDIGFSLGSIMLGGAAWALRDWFHVQLVHAGLITILVIFCFIYKFVPESPEWLLAKGRNDEAVAVIQKMIKLNRGPKMTGSDIRSAVNKLSQLTQTNVSIDKNRNALRVLFTSPDYRHRVLCTLYICFSTCFVFYGFTLNMGIFSDDIYLSFILSSLSSIPSTILMMILLKYIHLKYVLPMCNLLTALVSYLYVIGQVVPWFNTGCVVLGWVLIGPTVTMLYSYIAHVFPAELRCKAIGIGNFVARLGATLAPFVKELGLSTKDYIPMILFGSLCVLTAIIVFRVYSVIQVVDLPEDKQIRSVWSTTTENEPQQEQVSVCCTDNRF